MEKSVLQVGKLEIYKQKKRHRFMEKQKEKQKLIVGTDYKLFFFFFLVRKAVSQSKGFLDVGLEACLYDGVRMAVAVPVKVISRNSKDHVLVNFLSDANGCDKSFQVMSSRPASACRVSGRGQF